MKTDSKYIVAVLVLIALALLFYFGYWKPKQAAKDLKDSTDSSGGAGAESNTVTVNGKTYTAIKPMGQIALQNVPNLNNAMEKLKLLTNAN